MNQLVNAERAALVQAARTAIVQGSQSFAAASRLFAPVERERAWLLYSWCRAADDITDGQELGHGGGLVEDAAGTQARLERLTAAALSGAEPMPIPFAALRQVACETMLPSGFVNDHLAGFALDAQGWQPQNADDLLRYCYHVAGSVGCMMAIVMGIDPRDQDTLDRACDLGISFQLANIARDVVPDARVGRCYLPAAWLAEQHLMPRDLADPERRGAIAELAARLILLAREYRQSARIGAARLPRRSRLAVLTADAIYGAIGEQVLHRGAAAWDTRISTTTAQKISLFGQAALRSMAGVRRSQGEAAARSGLWTRPRYSSGIAGSRN